MERMNGIGADGMSAASVAAHFLIGFSACIGVHPLDPRSTFFQLSP